LRSLFLGEHRDGQFHPLAPMADSRPQKQRSQMLFDRARADVQPARDFLVAASLHQQIQDLLVPGRHFDFLKIDHDEFPRHDWN